MLFAVVHAALAEEAFEVVVKIGCVFLVGADDEVLTAYLSEGFLYDKGLRRCCQVRTKQMPSIAQSLDYRVDVGISFIRLVLYACHSVLKLWRKDTEILGFDETR